MKNNYPIKYALIPMIEQVGWTYESNDLERDYDVVYYIISKCYLISEVKEYHKSGRATTNYHVVFPFSYSSDHDAWKREDVSYNIVNGKCTNKIVTDKIYNNFSDALVEKNKKNEKIFANKCSIASFDSEYLLKIKQIEASYLKTIDYYDRLEQEFKKHTPDLIVNINIKNQSVIISSNDEFKKYDTSLYQLMDLFERDNYIVYSINEDEYIYLSGIINDTDDLKLFNHTILLKNDGKNKVSKLYMKDGSFRYINSGMLQDEMPRDYSSDEIPKVIMYTTETDENIIESFHCYENIDEPIRIEKSYERVRK